VTNGRRMFVNGRGTSAWSRRYADLIAGHAADLGGADLLSNAQLSLIRRASAIECQLEAWEGDLSEGRPVDLDTFARTAGHLRRILETLGLQRCQRDVTTLGNVLRADLAQQSQTSMVEPRTASAAPSNEASAAPSNEEAASS
jgi:hypothetical protein